MATTRKQIGYGSQGSEVKELQTLLNKNGANLTVDGIYGKNTQDAVEKYQKENGLSIDGVTGSNTWSSLLGGGMSSAGSANKTNPYTSVDLSKYNGGYQKSDSVLGAEKNKTDAENALKNHGDFEYSKQGDLSGIMDKILNREEFKYDLNGDALYKQYKDKFITQGKMASQDVIGQAASMTGGFGNSFAATVGNQAFQQSLQQLNDVVPELYQLAYDRHAQEGQDLYNKYSLLSADKNTEYGMWGDKRNQLIAERDYAANEENNAYMRDYGEFNDDFNRDFSRYWQETQFGYEQERDAEADRKWEAEMDFNRDRADAAAAENAKSFAYGRAMSSIQAGIVPSDDVLAAAGMTKEEAQSLANAYKNSGSDGYKFDVDDWIAINNQMEAYAMQGEAALDAFLDGLEVNGVVDSSFAAAMMERFFPKEKDNKIDTTVEPLFVPPTLPWQKGPTPPYTYQVK